MGSGAAVAKGDRQPIKADVPVKVEGRYRRVAVPAPPKYLGRLLRPAGVQPGELSVAIKAAQGSKEDPATSANAPGRDGSTDATTGEKP